MYNYANVGCQPSTSGRGYPLVVGADPNPPSLLDKTKTYLNQDNSLVGVKNGYLLGGATLLGLLYYGYTKRWF